MYVILNVFKYDILFNESLSNGKEKVINSMKMQLKNKLFIILIINIYTITLIF